MNFIGTFYFCFIVRMVLGFEGVFFFLSFLLQTFSKKKETYFLVTKSIKTKQKDGKAKKLW